MAGARGKGEIILLSLFVFFILNIANYTFELRSCCLPSHTSLAYCDWKMSPLPIPYQQHEKAGVHDKGEIIQLSIFAFSEDCYFTFMNDEVFPSPILSL